MERHAGALYTGRTMSMNTAAVAPVGADILRSVLKHQYHAALATLKDTIDACPEDLWTDDGPANPFWRMAYHALFYTHLYLEEREETFRPWSGHARGANGFGPALDERDDTHVPLRPYRKADVLSYWSQVDGMVDGAVDGLDLHRTDSGFDWYPMSKLEHQIVNIRHVQHHAAQLADRLRNQAGLGTRWYGTSPKREAR